MNRKIYKSAPFIILVLLLTGCWDQRLLKDAELIHIGTIDLTSDGQIISRVGIPVTQQAGTGNITNFVTQTQIGTGNTVRESRMQIDKRAPEKLDASKNNILLLGEEFVQKKMYDLLDVFYRDPRSALNANVAITEGDASRYLDVKVEGNPLVSVYYTELIHSAEQNTMIPKTNLELLCARMFDEGQDFTLPYLTLTEDGAAEVSGVALFNGQDLAGFLDTEEAMMMLLLSDRKGELARMTKSISSGETPPVKNYITFGIRKVHHKIKLNGNRPYDLSVDIKLNLTIEVIEYPWERIPDNRIKKLNNQLSEQLTKDAKATIEKLQEANSDVLGIGRHLIAFEYDLWKQIDWKKRYPTIEISPVVSVEINQKGILN